VRPEGLCQLKNPITSSGIEPATFRLIAQRLNQLSHPKDNKDLRSYRNVPNIFFCPQMSFCRPLVKKFFAAEEFMSVPAHSALMFHDVKERRREASV
jgi:hypothetical protein